MEALIMAYKLKYYKDIETQGQNWRIEIHQKTDEDIKSQEIGPVVQGLKLIVQGNQADVDTPIVKTSLEMVFVDAYDLNDKRKCGYWEEFYTSSATEYMVKLFKNDILEWTGYITPDSFGESLQYHGSVTIIARDNLGSLQDYEYSASGNADGMQSIYSILEKGLKVISFPMKLEMSGLGSRRFPFASDSVVSDVWDIFFNNKSLADKTWQEAIESLLYSVGLVLRYVGKNTFILTSIRDLSLYDCEYYWDVPILDAKFCAYGYRELSPAAKSVVDEIKFDIRENVAVVEVTPDNYVEQGEYNYLESFFPPGVVQEYRMPVYNIQNNAWSTKSKDTSLFLNPFAYSFKPGQSSKKYGDLKATDVVYIAANAYENNYSRFVKWHTRVGPGKYRFSFVLDTPVGLYDNNTKIGFVDFNSKVSDIRFHFRWSNKDGSKKYEYRGWDENNIEYLNRWEQGFFEEYTSINLFTISSSYPYNIVMPELEIDEIGIFELIIGYVGISNWDSSGEAKGSYVQLKGLTLDDVNLESTTIPDSLKVTTQYNAKNNIRIQRNAQYGFNMGEISSPKTIPNGLYVLKDSWYYASDQWIFNLSDTPQPLSVLLHQQLLAYYSKPNNVLTGELATPDPLFNALYNWKGANHLLMSGSLNILTGRMEDAILREFARYDKMWETWAEQDIYQVDYLPTTITARVFSKNFLVASDLQFPDWISGFVATESEDVCEVVMDVQGNDTGITRRGIVKIDTAYILVEQFGAGDYGVDYGSDYS